MTNFVFTVFRLLIYFMYRPFSLGVLFKVGQVRVCDSTYLQYQHLGGRNR